MDAVLVVDMLNDFLKPGAPLEVQNGRKIVPNIKIIVEKARSLKVPVIYLCDSHLPSDGEFKIWPVHAVHGTGGDEVYEEVKPEEGDYIVLKRRYSGFYQTDLDLLLRELSVKRVFITGLLTNICVLFTAVDAYMRGYETIIVSDATASLTDADQNYFLNYLKNVLRLKVMETREVLDLIQGRGQASQGELCGPFP